MSNIPLLKMQSSVTNLEFSCPSDIDVLPTFINGRGVLEKESIAEFNRSYNRISNERLDNLIESIWKEESLKNKRLFDGKKFRLKAASIDAAGVKFKLGLTSYKEFLGTNLLPKKQLEEWLKLGKDIYGDATAYLSNPLGNGILLESLDDQFIFIRRSENVTEDQGMTDRPGGHSEPECIPLSIDDASSDVLIKEIFDSVIREVEDEINITREHIYDLQMIGIVYNKMSAGRASTEFLARCSLTAEEMKNKYIEGIHKEAFESTDVIFIPQEELKAISTGVTLSNYNLTPAAKGAIYLYQKMLNEKNEDRKTISN